MDKYRDMQLGSMNQCNDENEWLTQKINVENRRQLEKWGVQEVTLAEWMLFLTEEVGELAEAIAEMEYRGGSKEDAIKEGVQVCTLALKITESIRVGRVTPP